jgi:hypothetical protein
MVPKQMIKSATTKPLLKGPNIRSQRKERHEKKPSPSPTEREILSRKGVLISGNDLREV